MRLILKVVNEFKRRGGIPPLLDFPDKWLITSPFGMRRHPITGQTSFHNGIDIVHVDSTTGREIIAPYDGTVVYNYNDIGGYQAIVYSEDKILRFGFAHLKRHNLKFGRKNVKKGDTIGYADNSGRSTGPHIHMTIAILSNGMYVKIDPEKFFHMLGRALKRREYLISWMERDDWREWEIVDDITYAYYDGDDSDEHV